jgi:hypothetical protein
MNISDQFQITLTSEQYALLNEVMSFAAQMDFDEHSDEDTFNSTWDVISNAEHNIKFEEVTK